MNKLFNECLRFNKYIVLKKVEKSATCALYSTKAAIKSNQNEDLQEKIKQTERVTHLFRKPRVKQPQRPPFAKNLFIGKFDPDILTYPQLQKDELEALENALKPIADVFNSRDMAEIKTFSNEFVQSLYNLCLFGLRAPVKDGGRELTYTENCKFNEIIAGHELGRNLIANEQYGIQAILRNANDKLRAKYLPGLISGQLLSAFCATEEGSYDSKHISTKAVRNPDGSWTLTGQKSWVINGTNADLFIVIAETNAVHRHEIRESISTAFIVEKNFGGITTQKCNTLLDSDISDVYFSNTCVPAENVLGIENHGQEVIGSILDEIRLNTGPACITLMKGLVNKFTEHCKNVTVEGDSIIKSDSAATKIGDLITATYVMESATYLTSLLLDQYENQDCTVEAAIVKVFSSEQSVLASLLCMDFLGTSALETNNWMNKIHREALGYSLLTESNETLKLVISLFGLQHAGISLQERVRKMRNPFFHPWECIKQMWQHRRQHEDNPKLNLNLAYNLHPSINQGAEALEYCVLRLGFATELLFIEQGIEVVNDHQNLRRLAECVIDIYVMTACLARASRSYCIGLRHANIEILMATTFCVKAKERVRQNVLRIWEGKYNTGDESKKVVTDTAAQWNGYFLEHPLARNF